VVENKDEDDFIFWDTASKKVFIFYQEATFKICTRLLKTLDWLGMTMGRVGDGFCSP
jgi:hypothetical protein